jgi:glucose-1-phosphate thymidylyltransferase
MTAIILAAGYGTRLYPLTLNKPKALLEVGGKTILDRLVEKIELVKSCKKIIIVTNEKFYKNFRAWAESRDPAVKTEIINDKTKSNETRLGAIGDINLVMEECGIADDLLITGSDNLFKEGLAGFVKFGESKRPASAMVLFDIKDKKLATKYGICSLDKDSRIADFEEKPKSPKSTLAAAAFYFISKEKLGKIPEYMNTSLPKDAPGNLFKWLSEKDKVFGYVLKDAWYDIGDKESLRKADEEFTKEEKEK